MGWTAVVPLGVAAMSIAMKINGDPTSKMSGVVLLTVIGLACSTVAAFVYWRVFRSSGPLARQDVAPRHLEMVATG